MAERTDLDKNNVKKVKIETVETVETADDPAQIRRKIEETRGEMSETIDALQERLSVDTISEQVSEIVSEKASEFYETAKDTVYDATLGKAGEFMDNAAREIKRSSVFNTITDNPLPLLLIATGAGMLFFGGNDKTRKRNYYRNRQFDQSRGNYMRGGSRALASAGDRVGNAANTAYDAAGNAVNTTYDKAGNAANSAYDAATGAANATYDAAGNLVNSAYQSASDVADTTMRKAGNLGSEAMDQYEYYIDESPLVIGAVALVAGALVGLAIPSTSYENQLVGEKRDNLLAQAKDTAKQAVDKAKNVAGQAVSVASQEAKKQVSKDQTKEKSA